MSDINVTPLVDVMLVLVVIFIITAPLLASSIRPDLPKTDGAKPAIAGVRGGGGQGRPGLFLDDQPVRAGRAGGLLPSAAGQPRHRGAAARRPGVPYGRVVEVMGDRQKGRPEPDRLRGRTRRESPRRPRSPER